MPISMVVLVLGAGIAAAAGRPKIPATLAQMSAAARAGEMAFVIVQFEKGPGAAETRKVEALGGKVVRLLPAIRSGVFSVPLKNVQRLSEEPDVVRVAPNRLISPGTTR